MSRGRMTVNMEHHEDLSDKLSEQLREIFEYSEQPIYLYLDDNHWTCNEKFSDLLGYNSPNEVVGIKEPFLDAFVDEMSQESLATAYHNAMERKVGSTIEVRWKIKVSGTVDTKVILVPISYSGHIFALHFISPVIG